MTKYVQHISGKGEKWQVTTEWDDGWYGCKGKGVVYYLPKSEYQECSPPERWKECTREVVRILTDRFSLSYITVDGMVNHNDLNSGYRWAWRGDALVIERKVEDK